MKTVCACVVAVLCCALALPATATAAPRALATTIVVTGVDAQTVTGALRSPLKQCLRDRVVAFRSVGGSAFRTVTAGRDGRFALARAHIPAGVSTVIIAVAKPARGVPCGADTADLAFDQGGLTGGESGGAFRGVLTTNVTSCRKSRVVNVFEVSSEPEFAGWNVTDKTGAWFIAQASGVYEARTDPVLRGSGDAYAACRGHVSARWFGTDPPEEEPDPEPDPEPEE
jgi:hypothetical protein